MALLPVNNVQAVLGGAPPTGASLLTPADFVYAGYWMIPPSTFIPSPNNLQGLTHRYVGGEFRLMVIAGSSVKEINVGSAPFSTNLTAGRTWSAIGGFAVSGDYKAAHWDEASRRFWTTASKSWQNGAAIPTQIYTRILNDDLTVSNIRGPLSLTGVPDRRAFGHPVIIPSSFRQQYGVGPYAVCGGGGASVILDGGGCSLGPTMYAINDPDTLTAGANNPKTTLMDFAPANTRRGARLSCPLNYLDGGDTGGNDANPPTQPPLATGQWLSPRADGKGWWTQCDSYWGTAQWIDTPTKHGLVMAFTGWGGDGGKVYYASSNVHCDYLGFELHVFNPAHLGEVAQGTRQPYQVEPSSYIPLTLPGLSNMGHKQNMTPGMSVSGMTFDPISRRLYLLGIGINNFSTSSRIYAIDVL